jgi:hypothetical protein
MKLRVVSVSWIVEVEIISVNWTHEVEGFLS